MTARAQSTFATGERVVDAAVEPSWERPTDQIALEEVARRAGDGADRDPPLRRHGRPDGAPLEPPIWLEQVTMALIRTGVADGRCLCRRSSTADPVAAGRVRAMPPIAITTRSSRRETARASGGLPDLPAAHSSAHTRSGRGVGEGQRGSRSRGSVSRMVSSGGVFPSGPGPRWRRRRVRRTRPAARALSGRVGRARRSPRARGRTVQSRRV